MLANIARPRQPVSANMFLWLNLFAEQTPGVRRPAPQKNLDFHLVQEHRKHCLTRELGVTKTL